MYSATVTLPSDDANESPYTFVIQGQGLNASVTGLSAQNSSPTRISAPTLFSDTISAGTAVSCTWNFGDGSVPVSGAAVSHTYARSGSFTAIVTATNDIGVSSATTQVTITPRMVHLPVVRR